MANTLSIQKLLANKHKYRSITISQNKDSFEATFYHKLKLRKDGTGCIENKRFNNVTGAELLPQISNDTVKHLGYIKYYHLVEEGFYINLYFTN